MTRQSQIIFTRRRMQRPENVAHGGMRFEERRDLCSVGVDTRENVVDLALRGLERSDPLVVTGLTNRLLSDVAGLVPVWLQLRATERIFRPSGTGQTGQNRGTA